MNNKVARIFKSLLFVTLFAVSPVWAIDGVSKGSLAEGGHKHYIPNVSNPFQNETPFITTEARAIFIRNNLEENILANPAVDPGKPGGGYLSVLAIQLRLALSDRLGVILNKGGLMRYRNPSSSTVSHTGFSNLSFGVKYALISDPRQEQLVTVGITYEAPSGTLKPGAFRLQGDGSGFINTFVTAAESVNKVGMQAMVGTKLSLDGERNVSWFNYALHMDYEIAPNVFPLVEFNGFVPMIKDARQYPFDYEGIDLVSFGATDPHSIITFAAGSRYKFSKTVMAGMVYEIPVSKHEDIMKWRVTADLVINF